MTYSLSQLNSLDASDFRDVLGGIFEHSSWIPEQAHVTAPFESFDALYQALCDVTDAAPESDQLGLIRAHPDLAGKLAVAGELTDHSTSEQQSARLDQLSEDRFKEITQLNEAYKTKFSFPFIICVKDHTQDSIFANFRERLQNDASEERIAALTQIKRIAWHRLTDTVSV